MNESPSLRHFPKQDPAPMTGNEPLRDKIKGEVEEYLAKGGEIQYCPSTRAGEYKYGIHPSKKKKSEAGIDFKYGGDRNLHVEGKT
jgi:hypothetical protein